VGDGSCRSPRLEWPTVPSASTREVVLRSHEGLLSRTRMKTPQSATLVTLASSVWPRRQNSASISICSGSALSDLTIMGVSWTPLLRGILQNRPLDYPNPEARRIFESAFQPEPHREEATGDHDRPPVKVRWQRRGIWRITRVKLHLSPFNKMEWRESTMLNTAGSYSTETHFAQRDGSVVLWPISPRLPEGSLTRSGRKPTRCLQG